MVYCDLSPRNICVTQDPQSSTQNVWLIDADNIFIPGEDEDKRVYTERYAAPELLSGTPCSQASDVYSFAVLAFESLASIDSQYSGKLPRIEDFEGLPRQVFLSDETFDLFNKTFSESGRKNPKTRPTAMLWARAFAHSYMQSVRCLDCNKTFVYDAQEQCPWCGKKLSPILVLKDEKGRKVFAHELVFCNQGYGEEFFLQEHIVAPFKIGSFFSKVMKIRTVNENGCGIEFRLVQENSVAREYYIIINGVEEKIQSAYILLPKEGEKYSLKCYDKECGTTRNLFIEINGMV
ncbi:protein kinase, partial [Candidatus Saccharibacteria bacterium]|nr:protein kinase [Candidatus Saccharibacteria bacterium]